MSKRIEVSFKHIKREIESDWDYANSWHSNLAMAYYDAGEVPDIETANKAADIFMERTFNLDMKEFHKKYSSMTAFYEEKTNEV